MFARAKSSIIIAGYAVYQGKRIFKELCERIDALSNLRVRMFLNITRPYQNEQPDAELLDSFARSFIENDWPGLRRPEVFYDPRELSTDSTNRAALHAKCVVVDNAEAFVTSANFTEAAQERNIEVGVLVRIPSFSRALAEQFENLVNHGQLRRVRGI
jgi:phosphatidylserine/phosphatidylglycerophosphate/cardiolipin synthase-like enzyme